jgi:DNA invertase Pin-like site-specific DNA recombinase
MAVQNNPHAHGNCTGKEIAMLIGYARVSTEDQNLHLQHDALKKYGVEEDQIYEEHVSAAKAKRPELASCLRSLREGDALVVWKLDRLARSLSHLIKITQDLDARKVGLVSLTEQIDTTTAGGRLIFHVFGAVAQFERDLVSERTKAGLAAARARGKRGGRPAKLKPKDVRMIRQLLKDKTVTATDIAKRFGVSRATVQRSLASYRKSEEAKELDKILKARKRAAKLGQ